MFDDIITTARISFTKTAEDLSSGTAIAERRIILAAQMNMIPIGNTSCYASMIAVPLAYPNVVVKICEKTEDAFVRYAQLCHSGDWAGENGASMLLKVFAAVEISEGVWLFVIERLEPLSEEEYEKAAEGIYTYSCNNEVWDMANRIAIYTNRCRDMHPDNVMKRANGQIVLLDPVC